MPIIDNSKLIVSDNKKSSQIEKIGFKKVLYNLDRK